MRILTLSLMAILVPVSMAHHLITSFLLDNVRQDDVIRQPGTLNPIINPNDRHLACGAPPANGHGTKGTKKASIQPGSTLTFEWHTNWSGSVSGPEGVTDVSHKGPCAIYMRKVSDSVTAIAEDPRKPNWFKIWEDGVDHDGVFCTSRMRLNGGLITGVVPKHLENGDYLIRAETVSLNNAWEPNWQAQWYVGCAQVTLKDSEAPFVKPITVPIPSGEYANMNMPGLRYNIWYPERSNYSDYGPVPGPAVFNDGSDKAQGHVENPQHASTLPDGFHTIPWPFPTIPVTEEPPKFITTTFQDPGTQTRVLTKTVTRKVVKTAYVTGTSTPVTMHHRIPHHTNPRTEVVTSIHVVTVTRTIYAGKQPTLTPYIGSTATPSVTTATATTSSDNSGTIVKGRGYHYRRWHRHHARRGRFKSGW
ncbi:hypothetical protein TWF481_003684 [Arthrobotrys musiformis]|uniref:AA9 family lytic polysaccharide monooxygenase n=1 Tax=Arthrobotrys musiformis TaxID=47236 RepID=A0AAV9WHB2_9PEZI